MAKKGLTPLNELAAKYGRPDTEFLDTGIFLIHDLIGASGLPTGKFIEFAAEEGIGKTTIVVQIAKHLIAKGHKVLCMDTEGRLDEALRKSIGVHKYEDDDPEYPSFLYMCPGTYDELAVVLANFIDSDYDVVLWDSIANASVDISSEDDQKVISQKLGQDALEQTRLLKAFRNKFARVGKTMLIINQMRALINTGFSANRGKQLKPAGGKSYDHNLDIRIGLKRYEWIEDDNKLKIGQKLRMTTTKNTLSPAFREVEVDLIFGRGIDKTSTLMSVMENRGVVVRSGSYFSITGLEGKHNGRDALKKFVRENYDDCLALCSDIVYNVDNDGKRT